MKNRDSGGLWKEGVLGYAHGQIDRTVRDRRIEGRRDRRAPCRLRE